MFLKHLEDMVRYWNGVENKTKFEALDGLTFSILAALDGCSPELPLCDISVQPHEDDKAYCQTAGENWFEPGQVFNDDVHLHELWKHPSTRKT